uniref:Metallophos domain-containing protein n=1 Tax=Strongyloides papillosus TaxID=174720 RepID=A0A0N5CGQ5_STREA
MLLSVRKIFYSIVVFYAIHLVIDYIGNRYTSKFHGYEYGNVRRFFSVCKMGWLMTYLSYLAHSFLSSFFIQPFTYVKFTTSYGKFSQRKLNKWKGRMTRSWMLLSILAIGMYFLYFTNIENSLLYYIFGWANGLWIHMFMFSFGFIVLTFLIKGIEKFYYPNRILNYFYKCDFIKKFCTDSQHQVIFTLCISILLCGIEIISANRIYLKYHTLKIKDLKPETEGFRFALVTDLHTGALVYEDMISKVVDMVNEEKVDAIFLVGDVVDAPYQLIKDRTKPMKHFTSNYGTFFVTGNHEYYYGNVQDWIDAFKNEYGFKVLENDIYNLQGMCLVGLHDISAAKNNISTHVMNPSVINECLPDEPIIVLAHNPAATKEIINATRDKPVDLILSGHTHAGQYYVMIPYVLTFLPYFHGFYEVGNGTTLVVSAGTLYQAAPMKMWYYSEIHIFTLVKG